MMHSQQMFNECIARTGRVVVLAEKVLDSGPPIKIEFFVRQDRESLRPRFFRGRFN